MDANQLLQEIFTVAKKVDDIRIFHDVLPFTNTEMQLMKIVVQAEEKGERVIASGVARSLNLTRSAISQLVKKLEKQQIIMRIPSERDKKSSYIVLTPEARAAYDKIREYLNGFVQQIVDRVGIEEILHFIEGMKKFIGIFEEVKRTFPTLQQLGIGSVRGEREQA